MPKAKCTCVDNYVKTELGTMCGRVPAARVEPDMDVYLKYIDRVPGDVCPTCAITAKARYRAEERDIKRLKEEIDKMAASTQEIVNSLPKPKFDPVSKPQHYNAGGVECIDALEAATVGLEGIEAVCTANAIKYLWRWKKKNGVEDLKKAQWYINRLINRQERK
jgi:hypothetical protein